MSGISTHVLDTARGQPAAGIVVVLEGQAPTGWSELARGTTDVDGRIPALWSGAVTGVGEYRLRFEVAAYFGRVGQPVFYPEVVIHVRLDSASGKFHLPLLLNPYGYSTYRGS